MEDVPNRVRCRNCGEDNFPSSERCWKCDRPLRDLDVRSRPDPTPAPPTYDESRIEPGAACPTAKPQSAGMLVILGFIFGGLGLLIPLLGIVGIVLGAVAASQGDRMGRWVILVSAIPLVLTAAVLIMAARTGMLSIRP